MKHFSRSSKKNLNENMNIDTISSYDALYVVERLTNDKNNEKNIRQQESEDDFKLQTLQFIPLDNYTNEESRAVEIWDRKNKNQRKTNSYFSPNPHLRHLNISTVKNKQTLPILKNGSRFAELKSCKSKEGKLILSNTCAFDSLTSLLMVSYELLIIIKYYIA